MKPDADRIKPVFFRTAAEFPKWLAANHDRAPEFSGKQPSSYRKVATHRVMRAKKKETLIKRLNELITESSKGKRLARFGG